MAKGGVTTRSATANQSLELRAGPVSFAHVAATMLEDQIYGATVSAQVWNITSHSVAAMAMFTIISPRRRGLRDDVLPQSRRCAYRVQRMRGPGLPAMTPKLDALLDARDRNAARTIDYDMQVLILLFMIAAVWGVLRGAGFESGRLFEVMLPFAGLFISAGWLIHRHLLKVSNEDYAGAIRATADSAEPGAQESVRDRLALRPAGAGLRLGQVLSIVMFALLGALAVWTYERDEVASVAVFPQEAVPVYERPPVVRVQGEVWLTAGDPCAPYGACDGDEFPAAHPSHSVAPSPSVAEFPSGGHGGSPVRARPYGFN